MTKLSEKARAHARIDGSGPNASGPMVSGPMASPPLAPGDASIDRGHLSRMTHGEQDLEREVLQLFAMQIDLLLGRMRGAAPAVAAALAHTLAGSARSIGAWKIAEAAAVVEAEASAGGDPALAVERLSGAAREAQVEIAGLMGV